MTPPTRALPRILRGSLLRFRHDPFAHGPFSGAAEEALDIEPDGLLLIENGKIAQIGPYGVLRPTLPPDLPEDDHSGCLIGPGFIDAHVHYPQLRAVASYGEQLLTWLTRYIFPEETRFSDPAYAAEVARIFLDQLLSTGTTTAAVYCTVHPESVEAFFAESARRNTRMIAGKVLMDRNAPDALCDTAQTGYDQSRLLIDRWHGTGRQLYAVTPRFAPTSTPEQLRLAGILLDETPGLYMQTHLLETQTEEAWVRRLFPDRSGYLDVYAHAGLVRPRAIFGHGVHLSGHDRHHCHDARCAIAHCPRSNLFLGSGNFDLFAALDPGRPVRVALGSDVGAGDSLSILRVMNEAYKVAHARGNRLHPAQSYWLATTGAACALELSGVIGELAPGIEADLCVLDPAATPLSAERVSRAESWNDVLFALTMLGDDRHVRATYVAGTRAA
ncbi:guanine deaminase [Acidomonas methanolica]|uniref:guanine deaminase n=2 Tax=Acidomonas methanolica TaxID=437 RepID=UPI001044AEAE|nr:guanine deaminase [Acidomonas methanolica]MBU2655222.1 guanine deaminase [Acidomonas methanolica]TCS25607.1 guanine deaminase [Acidomonas methanolica]GBQ53926.1 guanine deaminase [Acidomonas methanolica]GEK98732.1 guanine deaminase [Acidomonas methanolica NBRC 104435]